MTDTFDFKPPGEVGSLCLLVSTGPGGNSLRMERGVSVQGFRHFQSIMVVKAWWSASVHSSRSVSRRLLRSWPTRKQRVGGGGESKSKRDSKR